MKMTIPSLFKQWDGSAAQSFLFFFVLIKVDCVTDSGPGSTAIQDNR